MTQAAEFPSEEQTPTGATAPPAGFQKRGGDLVGYWEAASPPTRNSEAKPGSPPVLFTPLGVTLSDSQIEPDKPSTLIHCRLEADCELRSAEKGEGYQTFPKGSLFGIWSKPGMKPLGVLGGVQVWMQNDGFKEVGKPSPMVMFDIQSAKTGDKLRITDDRRDRSLPESVRAKREAPASDDLGDIPF